jgi:sugar/nucleoside kinase (ribokinase family)
VLCCIGDLVEDIVAWLSSDIAHGTDTDAQIHRRRGGSAANVAAAAAEIGTSVRFIGRVGADAIGAALVADLDACGVDTVVQRAGRTGTIVVLVDADGERSMLPDRAAAVELDSVSITDLDEVEWLHVPGYSLVRGTLAEVSAEAIRTVRARGGVVSIDASSVAVIEEFGVTRFIEMLQALDPSFVLCNRDEADLLGVSATGGLKGVEVTIVKDGADDAIALDDSGVIASAPARRLSTVRDTTGAGDAFAAGFITAMMAGSDLEASLGSGHGVAAGVLSRLAP